VVFDGGRFEVNNLAVVMGYAPLGTIYGYGVDAKVSAARMTSVSFERNDTSIWMKNAFNCKMEALDLTGTVAPYFGLDGSGGDFLIASINNGVVTTTTPHGIQNFLNKVRGGTTQCGIAVAGNSVGAYNNSFVATVTGPNTLSIPASAGNGSGGDFRLQLLNGLKVKTAGASIFHVSASAHYSGTAIDLSDPNIGAWGSTFISCLADHVFGAGGVNWKLPSAAIRSSQAITFIPNM
jgi:hypothetical protein